MVFRTGSVAFFDTWEVRWLRYVVVGSGNINPLAAVVPVGFRSVVGVPWWVGGCFGGVAFASVDAWVARESGRG